MPVPKPSAGESKEKYIPRCISFLAHENENREEKRPHDQIVAICHETWRDSKRAAGEFVDGDPIPILRTFESKGKRYVYGYAAIFESPDFFGTVITKEIVESSLPHLRKFPAIRFMHKTPFAQILFDVEVEGVKTFIDNHGFHILGELYDGMDREWSMVHRGGWGFSYGLMPAKDGVGTKCFDNGKCYPAFEKGILYEVSVVDAPAHSDAVTYTIKRLINGHKGEFMSTSQGGDSNLANKLKGEKKNLEKADIEQMLKDAEERITKAVIKTVTDKKTDESLETNLKKMEERITKKLNDKLAEVAPKKITQLETTFNNVSAQVKGMDDKLNTLRAIQTQLKAAGEDNPALAARIKQIEIERAALEATIVSTVEDVVTREMKKVNERIAAMENTPEFRSPATHTKIAAVQRGFGQGFVGMFEAAFRGEE